MGYYRYSNSTYGGYNANRSYNRKSYNYSRPKKKHSGAKFIATARNGSPCISAWNYSKRMGLVKILIAPYSNTSVRPSKSGREYHVWMCKIQGRGVNEHFPVLVDCNNRKAYIKNYGWVINCNAPNGGYCGTFSKRR